MSFARTVRTGFLGWVIVMMSFATVEYGAIHLGYPPSEGGVESLSRSALAILLATAVVYLLMAVIADAAGGTAKSEE